MQRDVAPDGALHGGRPRLLRYSIAVAGVAVGLLLAVLLQAVLDPETLLLAAALLAAWSCGLWPALLASVLATLAVDYYFTAPVHTIRLELAHVPRLAVFALLAAFVATVSAARRTAEHSLKIARDEMETRVQERTAELRQSNMQLHAEITERLRAE